MNPDFYIYQKYPAGMMGGSRCFQMKENLREFFFPQNYPIGMAKGNFSKQKMVKEENLEHQKTEHGQQKHE